MLWSSSSVDLFVFFSFWFRYIIRGQEQGRRVCRMPNHVFCKAFIVRESAVNDVVAAI